MHSSIDGSNLPVESTVCLHNITSREEIIVEEILAEKIANFD